MINDNRSREPYVKFYGADEEDEGNESSIEESQTKRENNIENVAEIVTTNSNSAEIPLEKQPMMALRFLVSYVTWLGLFVVHGGRFFTYVAISEQYMQSSEWDPADNISEMDAYNKTEIENGNFNFRSEMIGVFSLFSFFCGYTLSGIPGGYLSHKYPATCVFSLAVTFSSLVNIFYPLFIRSFDAVIIAHFTQGLAEGMILPAFFGIWTQWSLPKERNAMVLISYTGIFVGLLAGSEFSRQLLTQWTTGIYMFGLLALIWLFLWICVFNIPRLLKVNPQEPSCQDFVCNICSRQLTSQLWPAIIYSKPVWAIMVASVCHKFHFAFMFHPELMYHFELSFGPNITDNFVVLHFVETFFIPLSVSTVFLLLLILLSWYLEDRRKIPVIHIRKIFTCLGILLEVVAYIIDIFIYVPLIQSFIYVIPLIGYFLNPFDIAPKYVSILMGISNTFSTFIGVIIPYIFLIIFWHIMFARIIWILLTTLTAILMIIACVFYGMFASSEKQPWAD